MRYSYLTVLMIMALILPASMARATESAFGRYIPGVYAGPASEIIPPVPGVYWQSAAFYYHASADASLSIPFGRNLQAGIEADFFNYSLSGLWVPDWSPGENMNVGLGLTIPLQSLRISSSLGRFGAEDHSDGLGDIMLLPTIGWHKGPHLWAANVGIFMPTGRYRLGDLANIGLNCWTFSPGLAYTYINPEAPFEFSFAGGIDLNTKNPDTDYRSGAMAHADATLLWTPGNGWGLGGFGAVLYQISDDQGALADRLDGFRGRSFAIGPMIKYTGSGEHQVTIDLNWAPEFGVKNRLEGDAVYLNLTGRF